MERGIKMEKIDRVNRPFVIGTPSLFFINSPFQALCMLEAIEEFCIKDYKVFLVLYDDMRNNQLMTLLDKSCITYTIIDGSKVGLIDYITLIFSYNCNRYKRAFIGHYNSDAFLYYAIKKLSRKSDIIYLDDGAATIPLLKGSFKRTFRGEILFDFFKSISYIKGISLDNIFTIYDGIINESYRVHICGFNRLNKLQNAKKKGGVLIIGTHSQRYCEAYGLNKEVYSSCLDKYLCRIANTYPNEKIVFVPHGRDNLDLPLSLCEKYKIVYQKVDTTVELYVLNSATIPIAIYGFTSSALFNLKKIIPSCQVNNILLSVNNTLEEISLYYETIGIKTIRN